MAINGYAPKRDANEGVIIKALRDVGASVWQISGKGVPDLLICYKDECYLFEVKSSKGKLTPAQVEFQNTFTTDNFFIIRSPEEALHAIGVIKEAI